MHSSFSPRLVLAGCTKLLLPKYKWLPRYYDCINRGDQLPRFKLPDDPAADIDEALSWEPVVQRESKGVDLGDDSKAVRFRDEGQKIYRYNSGMLYTYAREMRVSALEQDIAQERWSQLADACYQCRLMMRQLAYNDWSQVN